jgi:hypothetical protein
MLQAVIARSTLSDCGPLTPSRKTRAAIQRHSAARDRGRGGLGGRSRHDQQCCVARSHEAGRAAADRPDYFLLLSPRIPEEMAFPVFQPPAPLSLLTILAPPARHSYSWPRGSIRFFN